MAKRRKTRVHTATSNTLLKWLLVLCVVALWTLLYLIEVDTLF